MKLPLKPILSALAIALLSGALAAAEPAKPEEKLAATINGERLTVAELDRLYAQLQPQMRESYDRSGGKLQFLDYYIRKRLVVQQALKESFDKRPEIAFDLQQARDSTLFDRYVREIVSANVVKEEELKAFYEQNKADYRQPEMIRARHIITTAQNANVVNTTGSNAKSKEEAFQTIATVLEQIKRGASFSDLAAKYSEDGTASSGGDLGWFARGKMVEQFDAVAFALKKGEVSRIVETEFGYHVIVIEDRKPSGVPAYEELRPMIRDRFVAERSEKILTEVTALSQKLRAVSSISVYRENL